MEKEPEAYQFVIYNEKVGLVIDNGQNHPDCKHLLGQAKLLFDVFPDGHYCPPLWHPCEQMFPATQQDMSKFKIEHSMFWFGCQMLRRGNHLTLFGNQNAIVNWMLKNAFPLWKEIHQQAAQQTRTQLDMKHQQEMQELCEQHRKVLQAENQKLRNLLDKECERLNKQFSLLHKRIGNALN